MYVQYKNFVFNEGEATLANVALYRNRNSRGFTKTQTVRFDVEGEVCGPSITAPSDITTRLNQIITAINEDGGDIGLYHDDSSPTAHYLESNNPFNLTGNQLIYQRFPHAKNAEYVDGRLFGFGIGAEILAADTSLLDYQDAIIGVGNGGPVTQWKMDELFGWQLHTYAPTSIVRYIHTGYAVTLGAIFSPPGPLFGAPFVDNERERITFTTAERLPFGLMGRRTQWRFEYVVPGGAGTVLPVQR